MRIQLRRAIATAVATCAMSTLTACGGGAPPAQQDQMENQEGEGEQEGQEEEGEEEDD